MENKPDSPKKPTENGNENFPGYPTYPPNEDIYNQFDKEEDIDPEDITHNKIPVDVGNEGPNIKDFDDDVTGDDLDIPGAEDDDQQEEIGSEDEENNSYSLGGDNHEDAEENQGDDYSSPRY